MSHVKACEELIIKEGVGSREEISALQCSKDLHASFHENIGELARENTTQNGAIYVGTYKLGAPDGFGKYLWSDGCVYEGEWVAGKASGRGKMSWPSGATYEGDFLAGNIHGVGIFEGHGNTVYKGSWVMNVKHGLGRKLYSNGDVYEGLWKQGMQDGLGRYIWIGGNMYSGEWKKGKMCGKGCFTWESKELYDGQWQDGLPHGHGSFIWADGSAYSGLWSRGKKDGKGTYYPPGSQHTLQSHTVKLIDMTTHDLTHVKMPPLQQRLRRIIHAVRKSKSLPSWYKVSEQQSNSGGQIDDLEGCLNIDAKNRSSVDRLERKSMPVLQREYVQGVLISELARDDVQCGSSRRGIPWQRYTAQQPRKAGERIVMGHKSYDLMLNLQLGIRYSVGRNKEGWDSELRPSDFNPTEKEQIFFPKKGSQRTPSHGSKDFRWTDYCPKVFRKIRQIFKINEVDYLMSLCGNDGLRELSSPGKSGSVFYLSNDDRYMIKTLRASEVKVLLKMLQSYYDHLCKHAETLIAKFFGLHQVMPDGGKKIRVVIMGNIFCTELRIHRKFDLKGSLQGRLSQNIELDETTILKDQDLNFEFLLEPTWRLAFFEQVHKDCQFLESQNIMDYSLLLGVHFTAPKVLERSVSSFVETSTSAEDVQIIQETSFPGNLAFVAHTSRGSTPGPHVRGSPLKVEKAGHQEVDLMILATSSRLSVQLGVNMPALAVCRRPRAPAAKHTDNDVYDVLLYFGIVDILQNYGFGKRLEHVYKSLKHGSNSISAVNPHFYAQRFQELIHRFFPPRL